MIGAFANNIILLVSLKQRDDNATVLGAWHTLYWEHGSQPTLECLQSLEWLVAAQLSKFASLETLCRLALLDALKPKQVHVIIWPIPLH